MGVRDSAHDLIALVGPQEENDLAEEVAPAMGQPSADAVDEFRHGQVGRDSNRASSINLARPLQSRGGLRAYPRQVTTDGGKRPSKRRVRAIRDRLRELYGRPVNEPHRHPIAELVRTVLSQNTNDRNRDVAYARLRERFPTWEEVRDAPTDEVEAALKPGGLSATKAPRIQHILRELGDHPDLDWVEQTPRDE